MRIGKQSGQEKLCDSKGFPRVFAIDQKVSKLWGLLDCDTKLVVDDVFFAARSGRDLGQVTGGDEFIKRLWNASVLSRIFSDNLC